MRCAKAQGAQGQIGEIALSSEVDELQWTQHSYIIIHYNDLITMYKIQNKSKL